MKRKRLYINNDLSFSQLFYDNFRSNCDVDPKMANHEVRELFEKDLNDFIKFVRDKLKTDIKKVITIFGNSETENLNVLPRFLTVDYSLYQIENFLKFNLGEFENESDYAQELADEETAFYINCNACITNYLAEKAISEKDKVRLLTYYNEQLYLLLNNPRLNSKLIKGVKNRYLKFLKHSILYLTTEKASNNSSKIPLRNKLPHRIEALIYKYKADTGYITNEFNPAKVEREFGAKRKQAIYTSLECERRKL